MRIALLLLFLLSAGYGFGQDGAQSIDPEQSGVEFRVRNMQIRHATGTLSGLDGRTRFDPADLASSEFDITMDVSTINTNNKKRDDHLRAEDFFDVGQFPRIRFVSSRVEEDGEDYRAIGELTIRDLTKEVILPFRATPEGSTWILQGRLTINRDEWNIGPNHGGFMIGKDVEVAIRATLKLN